MENMLLHQDSLASIAARSFALLLFTAGIAFSFRRRSAAVRHGIWTVGLGGCLVLPIVVALAPSWPLRLLPPKANGPTSGADEATVGQTIAPAEALAPAIAENWRRIDLKPPNTSPPTKVTRGRLPNQPRPIEQSTSTFFGGTIEWPSLATVASTIWVVGFGLILLRLLRQEISLRHMLLHSEDLSSSLWREERDIAADKLGLRTSVALKRHSRSLSPMVVGLFRPVVILPDDANMWSPEHRHMVLLHELAHVKRHDVLTQTAACLACALNWFNPICWYGLIQMRTLREMACDDLVLTSGHRASEYASLLLEVARSYRHRGFSLAVGMAHKTKVEDRILAILDKARTRVLPSQRVFRILLVCSMSMVLGIGSLQFQSRADAPDDPAKLAGKIQEIASAAEKGGSATALRDEDFRTMEVRILNEEGVPLEGAKLYVGVWYPEGYQGEKVPKQYFADAHGIVELRLPRRLLILRMWPSKPGYVPLFVNFAEGKHEEGRLIPEEYEFRLEKGHQLAGRLVDEKGLPISDAKVQVQVEVDEPAWGAHPNPMISTWLTDSDFNSPAPITDSEGRWSIENAPAAPQENKMDYEFRLKVTHADFAGDAQWGELQKRQGITTKELRAGDATLTLNRGLAISGEVIGPDGRPITEGWVVWSDEPYFGDGTWETEIDDEGHFKTLPLTAGEYPVTVVAPGYAAQRRMVTAKAGMEPLRFQLRPGKRIEIRFVDSAGNPIPKVGVYLANTSDPNTWNGSNALHNHKHPNVPDYGIPRSADESGAFIWDWAPEEPVRYSFGAKGVAPQDASLVAQDAPHVITLAPSRVVAGTVTDASTGKPIEQFLAMPVIVFRKDFYHTRTTDAKVGQGGHYELPLTGSGDPSDYYRVRFEADGYRSVVSEESFGPLDGRAKLDISLQATSARKGRVVDADGEPVEIAQVLQASPTEIPDTSNGTPKSWDARPVPTDANGEFQLRATAEPVLVRAYHDRGFAEKSLAPEDEEVGVMKLQPWATVSGRLLQSGHPVADQSISFYPISRRGLTDARFQDSYHATSDVEGYFEFDRIQPMRGTLKAYLGPWRESPLTSSQAVPLDLKPGEHREITLGGEGATISGRVVATGRDNEELSKQWSLNYLVSRYTGVEYPKDVKTLSFDSAGPLQPAWLRQPDFDSWVATRLNYFVKLADDGQLAVHGVPPGEYDLVVQLYEQPAGCLVETIGENVVPVTITPEQADVGKVEIGDIEIQCRAGPRVGSDMRAFQFTDATGQVRYIDEMKGKYVLLHAWATWCAPCLESMPLLKARVGRYSKSPLIVVGLNIDDDLAVAKSMAEAQHMDWAQNYLGAKSELMRQLAVSSVPAYYLIGPDGKLVGSANQWEEIDKSLSTALE